MRMRRRILLQLTPLLDLMMTILFMQSVLLQDISSDAVKAKIKTEDTLEYSRTIEEGLRKENDALAKERNELRAELEKAQSRLEEAEQSKQAAEELAESATKNLERVGAITKDIFSISDESLEMLTNNLNPEQADRLRNDVERLKEISDSKALEELMKLDELRKRCDFWKIHITYDGFVSMEINDKEKGRFYIQDTSEAILTDFNKIVTENEEPKSIVLVILTHGNPIKGVVDRTKEVLNKFLQDQRNTSYRNSRFEFSDWGYVPDTEQTTEKVVKTNKLFQLPCQLKNFVGLNAGLLTRACICL